MYYQTKLSSELAKSIISIVEKAGKYNTELLKNLQEVYPDIEKIVTPDSVSGGIAIGVVFNKKAEVPSDFIYYNKQYHVPKKTGAGEEFYKKMKLSTDKRVFLQDLNRIIGLDSGNSCPEIRILDNQKLMLLRLDPNYEEFFNPTEIFKKNAKEIKFSDYKKLRNKE